MSLNLSKKLFSVLLLFSIFCLSVSMVSATDLHDSTGGADLMDNVSSNVVMDNVSSDVVMDNVSSNVKPQGQVLRAPMHDGNFSYDVSCESDFKKVFDSLKSSGIPTFKPVVINIVNDIQVSGSNIMQVNTKDTTFVINGNGHSIKVSKPNERDENHFLTCGSNGNILINNLTLYGFNTAILNHGNVSLDNVTFDSNQLNYWFFEDYGGAIKNYGWLECNNCNFTKNSAKYGGAIYVEGSKSSESITYLNNCHFFENSAYGIYGGDVRCGSKDHFKFFLNGGPLSNNYITDEVDISMKIGDSYYDPSMNPQWS